MPSANSSIRSKFAAHLCWKITLLALALAPPELSARAKSLENDLDWLVSARAIWTP